MIRIMDFYQPGLIGNGTDLESQLELPGIELGIPGLLGYTTYAERERERGGGRKRDMQTDRHIDLDRQTD